jgi:hypothetical protein
MNRWLRHAAVRLLIPLCWRLSRRRIAASLERFSQVEADSGWQMLQALEAVDDPHARAALFNNALEEVHHAAIFADLARSYADALIQPTTPARKRLYDPNTGLIPFEAYHFVGEVDVYDQFLTYAKASPIGEISDAFLRIRGDEAEHQKLAYEQLVAMVGSERRIRRLIQRVRLERTWDEWERFARVLGDVTCLAVLSVIYALFAPFVFLACRRRLRDPLPGPAPDLGAVSVPTLAAHS